jgi:Ca2+-dependent lipid-binding protein
MNAMDRRPIIEKVLFWILIYLLGYLRWDWLWSVVTLCACYVLQKRFLKQSVEQISRNNNSVTAPGSSIQPRPSDLKKVEWINMIISQVWPYLDGFLKLVLQSVEEDTNLKSRLAGYHIRSVSFPHGSLGKIPPKLTGIKFHQAWTI